jgi:hypothetical protein
MLNPEKRSWKARLVEEFENLLAIVAYLFVLLAVFQLHRAMILVSRGINYSYSQGLIFSLVNALVLGKFILIAEALHAGQRWQNRALLYSALFRSAVMAALLVACHLLEEGLVAVAHGKSFFESPDMNLIEILSLGLMVFVVLIPFSAFRELQRVLGKAELKSLFLQRKIANGSVNPR